MTPRIPLLLATSGMTMSDGVRTALVGLVGLLVVILGCLVAVGLVLRRRSRALAQVERERRSQAAGRSAQPQEPTLRDPMACPSCRREFDPSLRFCPHDASRLLPAPELLTRLMGGKQQGSHICVTCRRAYQGGVRFCPHDGGDLVPLAVYQATCSHEVELEPTGVVAKICPRCQGRYDFAATFCGKDGVELVVLN